MKRSEHEAIVLRHLSALRRANAAKTLDFVEGLAESFGVTDSGTHAEWLRSITPPACPPAPNPLHPRFQPPLLDLRAAVNSINSDAC